MEHLIDLSLLDKRVQIHLIGVGGNGAQMAACLARLDIAMKALGHPYGLHITAFDGDRVSEANARKQRGFPLKKATVPWIAARHANLHPGSFHLISEPLQPLAGSKRQHGP